MTSRFLSIVGFFDLSNRQTSLMTGMRTNLYWVTQKCSQPLVSLLELERFSFECRKVISSRWEQSCELVISDNMHAICWSDKSKKPTMDRNQKRQLREALGEKDTLFRHWDRLIRQRDHEYRQQDLAVSRLDRAEPRYYKLATERSAVGIVRFHG